MPRSRARYPLMAVPSWPCLTGVSGRAFLAAQSLPRSHGKSRRHGRASSSPTIHRRIGSTSPEGWTGSYWPASGIRGRTSRPWSKRYAMPGRILPWPSCCLTPTRPRHDRALGRVAVANAAGAPRGSATTRHSERQRPRGIKGPTSCEASRGCFCCGRVGTWVRDLRCLGAGGASCSDASSARAWRCARWNSGTQCRRPIRAVLTG